uniref:GK22020 n=1 Tax=Drosophila willistoni TaxID=7260 RepID=B4MR80_DROWI
MKVFYVVILSIAWLAVLSNASFINQTNHALKSIEKFYTSCKAANPKENGIITIQVNDLWMEVYCDVQVAGNGWLVIQRRVNAKENFFRDWSTYREGFGDLESNFFIGLEKLHLLTVVEPQELYVYLEDFDGESRYARYDRFLVGNEDDLFALTMLGSYQGNAGDSLRFHENMKFSTYDRDNDLNTGMNCAAHFLGGWWFNHCLLSNLNGVYLNGSYSDVKELHAKGISWHHWRGLTYSYKTVQLMIQPK